MTPRYVLEIPVRCECPHCGEVWEEPVEVEGLSVGDAWYTTVFCPACGRVSVVCHVVSVVSTSLTVGVGSDGRTTAQ